jgi:lactate dehydrogenase-like 2-hydroxyacid dehydrogenase
MRQRLLWRADRTMSPNAAQRRSVLVTRRLPQAVEDHLALHFDAAFNFEDRALGAAEISAAMQRYDALVPTVTDRITAEHFAVRDRRVRIVANFGAGFEHIDLEAARAAGVVVTNTPDALTEATAEIAILLMLMTARRASEGERELRAGAWTGWRPTHMLGRGLAGLTLGLIGFGRIAQKTAAKARALGMTIAYFSRSPAAPDVEAALGAKRAATLTELAAGADVISVHVPSGAATFHIVDRALIESMKPTAILINTARGNVVDEAALADALASGRLAAAGLDVYEREPVVHPGLFAHPMSVLLPHLGSATLETRTAMGLQAAANLAAYFAGAEAPNRVA